MRPFSFDVNTSFAPFNMGCAVATPCTWDTGANSWTANRRQSVVQAFYFANRFHDHLASLGFAGFEGADPVLVEVHNGAARGLVNNASMYTPPEGRSPRMELRHVRVRPLPGDERAPTTPRSSTTSTRTGSRTGSSPTRAAAAR